MDDEQLLLTPNLALMWTWWDDGRVIFGWLYNEQWLPVDPLWAGSREWN